MKSHGTRLGQVEVTFEYRRHIGPTYVHGGITVRFDSTRQRSYLSTAEWPIGDCHDELVREAIEQTLNEKLGANWQAEIVLVGVTWDPTASSGLGFGHAARAATLAALEV